MSDDDRIKLRLHIAAGLGAAAEIMLEAAQAHYLAHVMRARPGEAVALFNGRDGEWLARVDALAKGRARLLVERRLREQRPEPDLWLVFAPIKRARIDFVAEKATELGVSAILPVFTRRTAVSRVNSERLRANAVEAAEQCERLSVPEVREPRPLERLLPEWPSERRLLVLDEQGGGRPIAEALAALGDGPAAILVGPEGGFADSELDALRRLPFATNIGLGPRILRADTAALAALACWQALRGDWRENPSFRSAGQPES